MVWRTAGTNRVSLDNWTLGVTGDLKVAGDAFFRDGNSDSAVYIDTYSTTNTHGSTLNFRKSDNNTVGTVTQTDDDDYLGTITFQGVRTDSAFMTSSYISAIQNGAAGGSYIPSDLVFATSTDSALAEKMRITKDGLVGIGTSAPSPSFTVTVAGGLAADYKSFVINHPDPDKPNKDLVHGSSETDEHNVFVRGRAQSKIIDLPDYWPHLIHEDSITVQLTSIGDHQELYVESIKDNRILINNKKQNKINCFYLVHAERKDIGKLEVEPDKCNKE
jgi:hypothetical protein